MLKVFYTAGPGNAFGVFEDWRNGLPDASTSHVAYSRQFMDACRRHGAQALITSYHGAGQERQAHGLSIVRRPDPAQGRRGLAYHRGLLRRAQQNIRDATRFGANLVVLTEDSSPAHYMPLIRRGVTVVQALHTRLWREDRSPGLLGRLRLRAMAPRYRRDLAAVLSCSDVVTRQLRELAGPDHCPVVEFLPLYRAEHYDGMSAPVIDAQPLDIAFVGRIEANKGVLDLVEIARRLRMGGSDCRFHICGTGSAEDALRQQIAAHGLEGMFRLYGWCDRDRLRAVMGRCQLGIVPTRRDFIEGFNQVVVETILSGRPAIVSDICPAVNYLADSVTVVPAGDTQGYVRAIRELAQDRDRLARHVAACHAESRPFLDETLSFGAALDRVFTALRDGHPVVPRAIPVRSGDQTVSR